MKIRNKKFKALNFKIGAEATVALTQLAAAAKEAAQATTASFAAMSNMAKMKPPDKEKSSASQEYLSGFEAATKKLQGEAKKPLLFMQPKLVKADPLPVLEEVEDFEEAGFFVDEFKEPIKMGKATPAPKKKPKLPEAKPAPAPAKRKIILED